MKHKEIAKRYATALFEIGAEKSSHETFAGQLEALAQMLLANKELYSFATSPLILATEKVKAISQALKGAGLAPEVETLALLLAQRERFGLLSELSSCYRDLLDKQSGISRGKVVSSADLSDTEKNEIKKVLAQTINKKVELEFVTEKAVLGGVKAHIGSLVFDDSLSSHLRRIEENLNRSIQ